MSLLSMRGRSKGEKRHERRKIIISIILSFRKFWGREGSVHQRLFAIWVQKKWYLLTRLIVRKTSTNSKKNIQALLLSSPVYMICVLFSSPLFPTCWPCKKFGCENIFFNCLSLCYKRCFFFFSTYANIVLGRKKDAALFPLFF